MRVHYFTCDVFTEERFSGNPLAVFPDAEGLTDQQMQQIAREFNFSETSFVLPSRWHTRQIRIFTPTRELPFAGHPNLGTAFILTITGELRTPGLPRHVHLEQQAGVVAVRVERVRERIWCELVAPEKPAFGAALSPRLVAAAVALEDGDVVTSTHVPRVVSAGLSYVIAEIKDGATLGRARVRIEAFEELATGDTPDAVHLYARSRGDHQLRARMFAPFDGVAEDAATGSANAALAGLLGHCDSRRDGSFRWRILQGVEMGRPSSIEAWAVKQEGAVIEVGVGGCSVLVSEGYLYLD